MSLMKSRSSKRAPRKNVEAAIQKALIVWVRETYPEIRVSMSANENNHYHLDMGIDVGEPDLWLYKMGADNICHFLRLELKTTIGKLNPNQEEWNMWFDIEFGNCANHKRAVAYGFPQARELINNWFATINDDNKNKGGV